MKATKDTPVDPTKANTTFTIKEAQAVGPNLIASLRKQGFIKQRAAPAVTKESHARKTAR
jgi:hypothetical protein